VLWTIGLILLGLWAVGLLSGGTTGPWVHLLLAFAFLSIALAVAWSLPRRAIRR